MKTTFLVIALLFHADILPVEHIWTPPLVVDLVTLGVSLALAVVLGALRIAPEGYEDREGFHFKESCARIRHSPGLSILRPHSAG